MKISLLTLALVATLACLAGAQTYLKGDLNENYIVDLADLQLFAQEWLDASCSAPNCSADLDGVPGVGLNDFALMAANWQVHGRIPLVINEFMARNNSLTGIHDEWGDYDDWIEIYNYGEDAIDIGGMWVTDNLDTGPRWQIPRGNPAVTTIASGGYLLIWADNETGEGALHVPFALDGGGEDIGLYDADRNLIDSIGFGSQQQNKSYGRLPDGSASWHIFDSPTPRRPNHGAPIAVVINEIMYHPYHLWDEAHNLYEPENMALEYIELWNRSIEAVNLAGWKFVDGVDYVFPDVTLNAGEYLVVAADVNAFAAKYPGVSNVIGGWTGRLANSGEDIVLADDANSTIDWLYYADQGDWARRELGPLEVGYRGWIWVAEHDGDGKSLELINAALPNECGHNWAASSTDNGTPGAINSVIDNDIAPLIVDVAHFPIMPGPNDTTTVTARIIDEMATGVGVMLHYRIDRSVYVKDVYPHHDPDDYNDVVMFDDGLHGDEQAGDGVYGAQIPAHSNNTIIEFYVEARDTSNNSRTWPAPALIDGISEQVTNALYQVDNMFDPYAPWIAGSQPVYHIIMTNAEKAKMRDIVSHSTLEGPNSQMNATFISVDGVDTKLRYTIGVRNRGHGTRNDFPNNFHINFVHDQPWKDVTALNLNTKFTYLQLVGNALFRMSGLAQCDTAAVEVRVNGENQADTDPTATYGSYVHLEAVNSEFTDNHYPEDGAGNTYQCMRVTHQADLRYEGATPTSYRQNYFKETNTMQDDWSDLIELCNVLSNTPEQTYVQEVNRVINAEQWLRHIAVNVILNNKETTLANGNGDDYHIYSGVEDPRFVLIQHDLDSVCGLGQNTGLYNDPILQARGIPAIKRFLEHPQFAPRFYFHLRDLIGTVFSAGRINPFLDESLGDWVPPTTINRMKTFIAQRNTYILSLIPSQLTIGTDLPQVSGYHQTDVNTVALYGTADAVETRSVLVNGHPTVWSAIDGKWTFSGTSEANSTTLVNRGSKWRYFDEYTDLGPQWYLNINDSNWPEDDAELGYGDAADGRPEATTISYIDTDPSTAGVQKNITTYFTHRFEVNDVSKYSRLSLRILRDDGAVVYLNEEKIASSNMPQSGITYSTTASTNVNGTDAQGNDIETLYYGGAVYPNDDDFTNIDPNHLQNGNNILVVEIHQYLPTSADISFDLELVAFEVGEDTPLLQPGINRVIVQTFDGPDGTGNELENGYIDIWYNDGSDLDISGTLATNRTLDAASGPWHITGDIFVPSGRTLTIQAGTTLFFEGGTGITVQQGGRLVAEGTQYNRIRLTSVPGGAHWDGVKFDHTLEDNRLAYVDHEFGDGQGKSTDVQYSKVTIDNMTWSGTNTEVLNIDHPSVICRDSIFPSVGSTEPLHGVGLTGNEYLIFEGCIFGSATGYNDIIDFTGGRRPGPIFQLYNNIFMGGGDDGPDLDSTDAHIEGNIFMNFHHQAGSDGYSSAVATGNEGFSSEIYVARNIFINNDHGVLLKEDCYMYAQNNVFVDSNIAVVTFGEPYRNPPRTPGKGTYMEGNIFWNNAAMFEHFFQDPLPTYGPTGDVNVYNSILPAQWHYLGAGNIDADPLFVDPKGDFHLRGISPAIGSGLTGLDMGAYVPAGACVYGEPPLITHRTTATLTVGGPGITHYKYSVNSPTGPWSAELPISTPIELSGLINGQSYTVYVIGKNSARVWQESPNTSHTWTVDSSYSKLSLSELIADNNSAFEHEGQFPDIIELYYDGPVPLDLTGIKITDNPVEPNKFVFSGGAMSPGEYLILYADTNTAASGLHTGFALNREGDSVYLYDKNGQILDSVQFGLQLTDLSVGRIGRDGRWTLTAPTFGQANVQESLGNPDTVKINEWFTNGLVLFEDDFIELYNPHPSPVDIGGMYLTDNPVNQQDKHKISPLSFIDGNGFAVYIADNSNGPGHVNFRLSADTEMIGLFDAQLNQIDKVIYGPQTTDVSYGRAPDGVENFEFFVLPTPGISNPSLRTIDIDVTLAAENATKRVIVPAFAGHIGPTWNSDPNFDDSGWNDGVFIPAKTGGVGYDYTQTTYDPYISYDVEAAMYNKNDTCYIRIPFTVSDSTSDFTKMVIRVRYDDGYIAYINGQKVAERNAPATPLWNSDATGQHADAAAVVFEDIDISNRIGSLRQGNNILAIHALNDSGNRSDFLLSVELKAIITRTEGEFPFLSALDLLDGLRVTEVMYHHPDGSEYDFIELKNISDVVLDLNGVRFTEGIDFTFPQETETLNPGEYVVVISNLTAFESEYGTGINIAGQYIGNLSNAGENIILRLPVPLEAAILRFRYRDNWYPTTDGSGDALVIRDATIHPATWGDPESWQPAAPTPGES